MKILITGGSGFIGTELAKYLLKEKHEVTLADIKPPTEELSNLYKFCDITDPYQIEELMSGIEIVYHLAANPSPALAEANPRWDLRINVEGTMNIISSCMRHKARMLFTSTAAIKYSPDSCYAISKLTAEKYIQHYVSKGLDAVIVRLWNVYGPTQPKGYVIPDLMEKLYRIPEQVTIKGTGLEMRDFVYIDDVIRALHLVAANGTPGQVYEIGTGRQITIRELAELIGVTINLVEPKVLSSQEIKEWDRIEFIEDLDPIHRLGWEHKVSLEEGIYRVFKEKYLK